MEEKVDNKEIGYLKDDIKEIIIETDNESSKVVAVISDVLSPSKGYRVRVKFKDNDFNNRLKTLESKVNLLESKVSKSCQVSNEENKDNIKEYRPYITFDKY